MRWKRRSIRLRWIWRYRISAVFGISVEQIFENDHARSAEEKKLIDGNQLKQGNRNFCFITFYEDEAHPPVGAPFSRQPGSDGSSRLAAISWAFGGWSGCESGVAHLMECRDGRQCPLGARRSLDWRIRVPWWRATVVYVATAVAPKEAELKVGLYGDIGSANDNEAQEWRLLALDKATGKILWKHACRECGSQGAEAYQGQHCNSTPASDGQHVVAIFGSEGLFCFGNGREADLEKGPGSDGRGLLCLSHGAVGLRSSPIIHEGKVIVLCDVQKDSFIAAFDIQDGRELWRTPRKDVPTWGTPALVQTKERTQIVANGWHETAGY